MLPDFLRRAFQAFQRLYAVRANVSLGRNVHIGIGTTLWAPDGLRVEDDVYIGKYCTLECNGVIGSGTMLANQVGIVGRRDHDYTVVGKRIRHAPWIGDPGTKRTEQDAVRVGEDVWLGFGAIILSGVDIGRGAIVAAGSVVINSIEPYAIVAGSPARVVGTRFTPAQITEHERRLAERATER